LKKKQSLKWSNLAPFQLKKLIFSKQLSDGEITDVETLIAKTSLGEILKDIVGHIRYPLISGPDLVNIVKPCKVAPEDLYVSALEFVNAPDLVTPSGLQYKERVPLDEDEEEGEEGEEGVKKVSWDKKWMHTTCSLEKKDKVINMNTCTCFCTKGNKFAVKINSGATWLMVGFKNKQQKESGNMTSYDYNQGWFIYGGGGLYGHQASGLAYSNNQNLYGTGNIIGCVYDPKKKTINFWFNGKDMGVAFQDINEKEMFPCVAISGTGQLELVDLPKKSK